MVIKLAESWPERIVELVNRKLTALLYILQVISLYSTVLRMSYGKPALECSPQPSRGPTFALAHAVGMAPGAWRRHGSPVRPSHRLVRLRKEAAVRVTMTMGAWSIWDKLVMK